MSYSGRPVTHRPQSLILFYLGLAEINFNFILLACFFFFCLHQPMYHRHDKDEYLLIYLISGYNRSINRKGWWVPSMLRHYMPRHLFPPKSLYQPTKTSSLSQLRVLLLAGQSLITHCKGTTLQSLKWVIYVLVYAVK